MMDMSEWMRGAAKRAPWVALKFAFVLLALVIGGLTSDWVREVAQGVVGADWGARFSMVFPYLLGIAAADVV